jgi:hypothetical protein
LGRKCRFVFRSHHKSYEARCLFGSQWHWNCTTDFTISTRDSQQKETFAMAVGTKSGNRRTTTKRDGGSRASKPRATAAGARRKTAKGKNSAARGTRGTAAGSTSDRNRGATRERGPHSKQEASGGAQGGDARFLKKHEGNLSGSTLRAHWVNKPGDKQNGRDGQTLATRSHAVIQRWAKERGGVPATVATKRSNGRPRVLRIDFPDYSGGLTEIGWSDWFRTFDQRDLVFLFQETTKNGRQSNFFRLDSPHREDG